MILIAPPLVSDVIGECRSGDSVFLPMCSTNDRLAGELKQAGMKVYRSPHVQHGNAIRMKQETPRGLMPDWMLEVMQYDAIVNTTNELPALTSIAKPRRCPRCDEHTVLPTGVCLNGCGKV